MTMVMLAVFAAIAMFSDNANLNGIKSKPVGDGQHGTARWATQKEIDKAYAEQFKQITDTITDLKEKRVALEQEQANDTETNWRIQRAKELLGNASVEIKEWDEDMIRQLVESVKILSATQIRVTLKGGVELIRGLE